MGNESSNEPNNSSNESSKSNELQKQSHFSQNSIDPGSEHCQFYNTYFNNAEELSSRDCDSAFASELNDFHAAACYFEASKHGNHDSYCKDRE